MTLALPGLMAALSLRHTLAASKPSIIHVIADDYGWNE